jgi:hypothetical protein
MKQQTLAMQSGFEKFGRKSKRELFLEEMDKLVPWAALVALIDPHYPKGKNGRPPVGLERMLRLYFLQQWFNLSDPGLEDALYESPVLRLFAGIWPSAGFGFRPGPLWMQRLSMRPVRPRTARASAIRRCIRPRRATSGTSA